MDPAERCAWNRAAGQSPSTAVRGKAGEDSALHDQGEGADDGRPGPAVGGAVGQTRRHRQERPRPARQAGLGLHTRTARPSVRLFPGKLLRR